MSFSDEDFVDELNWVRDNTEFSTCKIIASVLKTKFGTHVSHKTISNWLRWRIVDGESVGHLPMDCIRGKIEEFIVFAKEKHEKDSDSIDKLKEGFDKFRSNF